MELKDFFAENKKVAVAFSGGTDSAYLLYAAIKFGVCVKAYYVKSAFQPQFELDDAKRLAEELGADMQIIYVDILANKVVTDNPCNRCYYCKKIIFTEIAKAAAKDKYFVLTDGTNASDDAKDRPGMRALTEMSVHSPLRDCLKMMSGGCLKRQDYLHGISQLMHVLPHVYLLVKKLQKKSLKR